MINLETTSNLKYIKIKIDISKKLKNITISLFKEFKDIFTYLHKDLKEISATIVEYSIDLLPNITSIQQWCYHMDFNYATTISIELDKLLKAKFISPINLVPWFLPIVIIAKKTNKLHNYVDFKNLILQHKRTIMWLFILMKL